MKLCKKNYNNNPLLKMGYSISQQIPKQGVIFNKKATTTLFASIIISIIAIIIGIAVANLTEHKIPYDEICLNSKNPSLVIENNEVKICKFNITENQNEITNFIKFSIINNDVIELAGLHMIFVGNSKNEFAEKRDYEVNLAFDENIEKIYKIPNNIESLEKIRIAFYLKKGEYLVFCPNKAIVTSYIPYCDKN